MSESQTFPERCGVLAAGNFIVDHVKMIDGWPGEEMLATISSEQSSNGGGAYNLLVDLSRLGARFPLAAAGLVGQDPAGDWIRADCQSQGIDVQQLTALAEISTSYTDAFTVEKTGRRTFFHHRGANAHLESSSIDLSRSHARLFYLGYLMLLDRLDQCGPDGRSGASHLLEQASKAGFVTVVDMVSVANEALIGGTRSALPYIDHFILNELEAGQLCGLNLRRPDGVPDLAQMETAATRLLEAGVRATVTIHAVEGAVSVSAGGPVRQTSVALPSGYIKGATGAGDAFAAGWVYALHEGWPAARGLELGVCAAAACLADPTPSLGVRPLEECLELGRAYGFRQS